MSNNINSQFQANQLLANSPYITSYGNYDCRSDEARQWLVDNRFVLESQGINDLTAMKIEALVGFDDSNIGRTAYSKNARPILESIMYVGVLPQYIESDLANEELAEKVKKYEERKKRYLEEGEKARESYEAWAEYYTQYIIRPDLDKTRILSELLGEKREENQKWWENAKTKVSYDHAPLYF